MKDEELVVVAKLFSNTSQNTEKYCHKLLNDFDLRMLISTCCTEDCYVFSQERTLFIETPKVKVADSVGAGDSYTAAFCASIPKGKSISMLCKRAVEVFSVCLYSKMEPCQTYH